MFSLLEKLAATAANKALGKLVQEIKPQDVVLNLISGTISVKRLRLREDLLEPYEIFADLKEASLDNVEITIPWKQLLTGSVTLKVQKLFLVVKFRDQGNVSHSIRAENLQRTKEAALFLFGLLGMDKPSMRALHPKVPKTAEEKEKKAKAKLQPPGVVMRKVWQLVDNVRVSIEDVHVRFEEEVSTHIPNNENNKFATTCVGVTLQGLNVDTVDRNNVHVSVTGYNPSNRRLISFKNLAIYGDTTKGLTSANADTRRNEELTPMILPTYEHEWVMHPLTFGVNLTLNREPASKNPMLDLDVNIGDFNLEVSGEQYQRTLNLITFLTTYRKKLAYFNQPDIKREANGRRNGKDLWKYCCGSVVAYVKVHRDRWSWQTYQKRKSERVKYVNIYRRKLYNGKLSQTDTEELLALEKSISFDDIVMYRKYAAISVEKAQVDGLKRLNFVEKQSVPVRGAILGAAGLVVLLFLAIFVGFPIAIALIAGAAGFAFYKYKEKLVAAMTFQPAIPDLEDSSAAWKPLFHIISSGKEEKEDEKKKKKVKPMEKRQHVNIQVSAAVKQIKAVLRRTTTNCLSAALPAVSCKVSMRPDSLSVCGGFAIPIVESVIDGKTLKFVHGVQPPVAANVEAAILEGAEQPKPSELAGFNFEMNPLDKEGIDMFVGAQTPPILITVVLPAVGEAIEFFTPRENRTEIAYVAARRVAKLAETARTRIKYAVLNKTAIQMAVSLKAPVIIVPESPFSNTPKLILDLGTIGLTSNPKRAPPGADLDQSGVDLTQFIFDRYSISVADIAALCIPANQTFEDSRLNLNYYLLNKFTLNTDVDVCTMPAADLPSVKVGGGLTKIVVSVSPIKVKRLLGIVNGVVKTLPKPPAVPVKPEPVPKARSSAVISKTTSNVSNRLSMMIADPEAIQQKTYKRQLYAKTQDTQDVPLAKTLALDMTIAGIIVRLEKLEQDESVPSCSIKIVSLELSNAKLGVDVNNKFIAVDVLLHKFGVRDGDSSRRWKKLSGKSAETSMLKEVMYIVRSEREDEAIRIGFKNVPRTSSEYRDVANFVKVDIGGLAVHIGASSFRRLLRQINETVAAMKPDAPSSPDSATAGRLAAVPGEESPVSSGESSPELLLSETDKQTAESIRALSKELIANVDVSMKSVQVILVRRDVPFTCVSLTTSTIGVMVRGDGGLGVKGALGALSLGHKSTINTEWSQIVSVPQGHQTISFAYKNYTLADEKDSDMSIKLKLSSVEFVFLNIFVKEILEFVTALTTALAQASLAPPPSATPAQAAAKDHSKPLRLSLNVFVGSPAIIVPHTCHSKTNFLKLSLGDITVSNTITKEGNRMSDVMSVDVSGFQLQSILNKSEFVVLKHTGAAVKLSRKLKASDFAKPDIDIGVVLRPIELALDQVQIDGLISLLIGNLREVPDIRPSKRAGPGGASTDDPERRLSTHNPPDAPAIGANPVPPKPVEDYVAIHINVEIPKFSLTLQDKQIEMLCLSTTGVGCELNMRSIGTMQVLVRLDSVDLNDPRLDQTIFRNLLAKSSAGEKVISVEYSTKQPNKTFICLQWNQPTIVVLPDTLLDLKTAFEAPVMASLKRMQAAPASTPAAAPQPAAAAALAVPGQVPEMEVKLELLAPKIILLRKPRRAKSRGFVLSLGDSSVKYAVNSHGTVISVTMKDFKFLKATVSPDLKLRKSVDILQPFGMLVEMTINPKAQTLGVTIDPVNTIIAYRDLQLVKAVQASFNPLLDSLKPPPAETPAPSTSTPLSLSESVKSKSGAAGSRDSQDLSAELSNSESSTASASLSASSSKDKTAAEQFASIEEKANKPIKAEDQAVSSKKTPFQIKATIRSVNFGLLDDRFTNDFFVPLMKFWLEPIQATCTLSDQVAVVVIVDKVAAQSYNRDLVGWEPIIEPWKFNFGLLQRNGDTKITLSSPIEESVLNLNINRTVLQSVFGMLDVVAPQPTNNSPKEVAEALSASSKSAKRKSLESVDTTQVVKPNEAHPFIFRNETGKTIKYWLSSHTEAKELATGLCAPLIVRNETRATALQQRNDYELNYQIVEGNVTHALVKTSLSKIGAILTKTTMDGKSCALVTETSKLSNGTHEITARGECKVKNCMDMAVHIKMDGIERVLAPKATYCIPILHKAEDRLLQVSIEGFNWCPTVQVDDLEALPVTCQSNDGQVWTCVIKQGLTSSKANLAIEIVTPLVVENLLSVNMKYRFVRDSDKTTLLERDLIHTLENPVFNIPALNSSVLLSVKIAGYEWSKPVEFLSKFKYMEPTYSNNSDAVSTIKFILLDPKGRELELRGDVSLVSGHSAVRISVYARYWIINNTGLRLLYKESSSDKTIAPGQHWEESEAKPLKDEQRSWYSLHDAEAVASPTASAAGLPAATSAVQPVRRAASFFETHHESKRKLHKAASMASTDGEGVTVSSLTASSDSLTAPDDTKHRKKHHHRRSSISVKEHDHIYTYFGGSSLSIKVEDSIYSKDIKLGASNTGTVTIKDANTNRRYMLSLSVSAGAAKFWRTSIVKLRPNFILVNNSDQPVMWKQEGLADTDPKASQRIEPGEQIPIHWPVSNLDKLIQIRPVSTNYNWSPSFSVEDLGRFPVKMSQVDSETAYAFLGVHIREKSNSSTFVVIANDSELNYARIDNLTKFDIWVREVDPMDEKNKMKEKQMEAQLEKEQKASADKDKEKEKSEAKKSKEKAKEKEKKDKGKGKEKESSTAMTPEKAKASASLEEVAAHQHAGIKVTPHSKIPFVWDEPQNNNPTVSVFINGVNRYRHIKINKMKELKPWHVPEQNCYLHFKIRVKGRSRILSITSSSDQVLTTKKKEKAETNKLEAKITLKGFGLSVVDSSPQEVMYLRIQDIFLKFIQSNIQQSLEFSIGGMQLDNDLCLTPYPVVMDSKPVPNIPFFKVALVKDLRYKDFNCFRYFAVAMQEIDIMVDQAFLLNTLSWVAVITSHMSSRTAGEQERLLLEATHEGVPMLTQVEVVVTDSFYFELFHINPMKINISYAPSVNFELDNLDPGATQLLLKLGKYLSRVEQAPVVLHALLVENLFATQAELNQQIVGHYVRQFISQALKVLGSADYLGNPVSMVRGIGTGVYTFVHEPSQSIVNNPSDLGMSIAKGTGALIKGTLGSVIGMAGTLVGNLAKVGEIVSLDDDYKREREIMKQQKAHNVAEGVGYGLKELGQGVFKGLTGIVTQPIKGARKEGLKGLGKGLGKGLIGVVVKPTVGAVDLVTRTTEGIKNTGGGVVEKKRTRLPRHFGPDQLLTLYDPYKADGAYVMKITDDGVFRRQLYVWHRYVDKGDVRCLLLSNSHVILFKRSAIADTLKMHESNLWGYDWKIKLIDLSGDITPLPAKNSIVLKRLATTDKASSPKTKLGRSNELVVPCKDNDEVVKISAELYEKVKAAPTEEGMTAVPSSLSFGQSMALTAHLKSKKDLHKSPSKEIGSTSGGLGGEPSPKEKDKEKPHKITRTSSESQAAKESSSKDEEHGDGKGGLKGVGKSIFNVMTFKGLRKDKDKGKEKEKEKSKQKEKDKDKQDKDKDKPHRSPRKAESVAVLPHHTETSDSASEAGDFPPHAQSALAVPTSRRERRKSLTLPPPDATATSTTSLAPIEESTASEADDDKTTKKHHRRSVGFTKSPSGSAVATASTVDATPATATTTTAGPAIVEPEPSAEKSDGKTMKHRKSSSSSLHSEAEQASGKTLVKRKSSSSAPHKNPDAAPAPASAEPALYQGDVELRKGGTLTLGKSHKTRHLVLTDTTLRLYDSKEKTKVEKELAKDAVTAKPDSHYGTRLDLVTAKKTVHLEFPSEEERATFVAALTPK